MDSTREHYDRHLGPVYSWMAGGRESAMTRGAEELDVLGIVVGDGAEAIDLGAGFGMHAIPLAQRGFDVLAIDSCAALLAELRGQAGTLPIPVQTIHDDLRSFARHRPEKVDLVLCMGDTLTHLPDEASIAALVADLGRTIREGGRFVATLRDYSTALLDSQRFIPVRSDPARILTCFLEYADSHVTVHDILHTWDGSAWSLRVSAYQKLRIDPDRLEALLRENGFVVERATSPSGMLRF
ncbi:MAG TPA: class I SAM-dependent methyltransferase, partial [Myxococcota bacterium]|nr:class I SAM-dependent methyltransferase [Myxococcota bacterium]